MSENTEEASTLPSLAFQVALAVLEVIKVCLW